MYLMNVPPVAATQTEWRTCGPPGGYSLPACFNDSDTELSTRGTPISDKVQMIIESLRCTQSSLEMGDEIEGNVPSGQEGHPQVCKVQMGSYMEAKPQTKGPIENQQTDMSFPVSHDSSDSDSDDSVDRGIEEAIAEYLREKDGHKRKAEPPFNYLQSSKIPRKNPPMTEVSQQNCDSNICFLASNQFPKDVKAETPVAPAAIPIKKYIKNKAFMNDNTVKKFDSVLLREQMKGLSKSISPLDNVKCPVPIKVGEGDDSSDSSSDDGIEEAIQRYQLEKKEQQNRETFNLHEFIDESDSTSDDGIEEAIRHYQLEQLKEKSVLSNFIHKQKPFSKPLMHSVGSTSVENMKTQKMRKKKIRTEREGKSVQSLPTSAFAPKKTLPDSSKGKGNGLLLFKMEGFKEQPTPAPTPPKVNTTAELMCAEAILDISKTVIPGPFHQSVGLSSCAPTESSLTDNCPDEESEGSSIDSEDGIEQEIRNFLEQKAQMHKRPTSSAVTQEPHAINEPEVVKGKEVVTQKKPPKLSLTQRRKHKEEIHSISNMSGTDTNVKETPPPQPLPEHREEPSPVRFSDKSQTHAIEGLHVTEQSGEKSSSLDSDEDLDTAIKDLLKTKKKSKKKIRDLKRKSRKCLKEEEPLLGSVLQTKKFQLDPVSKRSALKKVQKSKDGMKDKSGLSKKSILQPKQADMCKEHDLQEQETEKLNTAMSEDTMLLLNTAHQMKEDSSSIDSDDSIEQEIRRFLAHKAKVTSEEKNKDNDVTSNGTALVCTLSKEEDIKQENQLAEIPGNSISPLSGQSLLSSQPLQTPQHSLSDIASVGAQSHQSPAASCNPFLEPADGAGAARTEQRKPEAVRGHVQDVGTQNERVKPELSPYLVHSRSEAMKWRQSFGLPATDPRTHSRTSCHVASSKIIETASATPPYQRGDISLKSQTPVSVWSSARTSRVPFSCSTETVVNTTERDPVLHVMSTARQYPRMPFARSVAPGHKLQCPIEGETKSMVHMLKDKSVFVELESNRTNHVQVRSRERSEEKERMTLLSEKKREVESMKTKDKEVRLETTGEEFIDEGECESGNSRNPEKKQGFSTLSLSSAIDPGITFRPCIALTTEERSMMFSRRCLSEKTMKVAPMRKKAVQHVKRKLQFVAVNRGKEATTA